VRRGIAAVLAMQYEITDRAAIEFSRTFYRALAYGLPIDAAVASARIGVSIGVNNSLEWGTPVLYMRSPDGVLFELAARPAARPGPEIVETIVEPTLPEPTPRAVRQGHLWVETDPPEATVSILNLQAEFAQGQELEPGSYHVEVAAAGYAPKREWIELKAGEDKHLKITLTKIEVPVEAAPRVAKIESPLPEPAKPPPQTEAPHEKEFTNSLGMTFRLIPAGYFYIGSQADEEGRYDNEQHHQVTLSQPFSLQTTPVTQRQWQQVMGNNPSGFQDCGDDCPVEEVSWDDAQEFLGNLNRMEQTNTYRLPTEAEWEYACRAGSTTRFCCGDEEAELQDYAWYDENSEKKTHPVGQKQPNAWGLYDMHGNVWEWCQDWYRKYSVGPVTNPRGPDTGERRVLRGGSWNGIARNLRSAGRNDGNPGYRNSFIGFRVARTVKLPLRP
jgi:formylglycine-generating enzyme required for sulfatase activity